MQRQLFLVAYDVRAPARLRHALHVLKDYASGGQRSAFECFLSAQEKTELLRRITDILDEEDAFAVIPLLERRLAGQLGIAVSPQDQWFTYLG